MALALGSAAPVIMPFETAAADDTGTTPIDADPSSEQQLDGAGGLRPGSWTRWVVDYAAVGSVVARRAS